MLPIARNCGRSFRTLRERPSGRPDGNATGNSRADRRPSPHRGLLRLPNLRNASADTESKSSWAKVGSVSSTWPATISFSGSRHQSAAPGSDLAADGRGSVPGRGAHAGLLGPRAHRAGP